MYKSEYKYCINYIIHGINNTRYNIYMYINILIYINIEIYIYGFAF